MVFETVATLIAQYIGVDESDISPDTSFEDLGIDCIDLSDIVMALEDELGGVDIELDSDVETVGELVECIERQI